MTDKADRFVWEPGDVTVVPPAKDGGEVVFTIDKDVDQVFDFYKKAAAGGVAARRARNAKKRTASRLRNAKRTPRAPTAGQGT